MENLLKMNVGCKGQEERDGGRGASLGLESSRKLAGQGSLRCRNGVIVF